MNSLTRINNIAKSIKSLTQKDFQEASTLANPQLLSLLKAIKKTLTAKNARSLKSEKK